ncbi:helix-turn-helix domain-containing protein [Kitasatospora sp. NPDC050463]|uniref:GbsR/MarR family transcriptional regulator n=1 Tax=Kitasatospora sp. NPDC050463 TaxID=3155786 RepID=UPI0033DB079F
MPGGRLTDEDRRQIAAGLADGLGYTEIGRRLYRPASTIMREVARNGGPNDYRADRAKEATLHRARRPKQDPPGEPLLPTDGQGRDPHAVREVAESVTALIEQQGMPTMTAKVLVCLLVTDSGTLTAADLVQQLRVSPASVSHAVAFLEQQGLLRRERLSGERRERYVIDGEIWLRSTLAAVQMHRALVTELRSAAEALGPTTPAGARFGDSAEFLTLMGETLQRVVDQWQQSRADHGAVGGAP